MQKVKVTCSLSFLLMAVNWADQMMNLIMESKKVVRARSCSSLFFLAKAICGLNLSEIATGLQIKY